MRVPALVGLLLAGAAASGGCYPPPTASVAAADCGGLLGNGDGPAKEAQRNGDAAAGGDGRADGAVDGDYDEVLSGYEPFVAEFSKLYCRRLWTCCAKADRDLIAGTVDEGMCAA